MVFFVFVFFSKLFFSTFTPRPLSPPFFPLPQQKQQFMPFSKDGVKDMFWPAPWDHQAAIEACLDQFGVAPDPLYASREWGGKRISMSSSSSKQLTNVVFSNGLLDPWHGGGVLDQSSFDPSVVIVLIPEGGHHVDLFFENEADPESVRAAREVERGEMRRWVERAKKRGAARKVEEEEREDDGVATV